MECPYCDKEMEKGLIPCEHTTLGWYKGERKLFTQGFFLPDVVLSEFSAWKGSAAVAYCCAHCRKIIIDYSDEKTDLNKR